MFCPRLTKYGSLDLDNGKWYTVKNGRHKMGGRRSRTMEQRLFLSNVVTGSAEHEGMTTSCCFGVQKVKEALYMDKAEHYAHAQIAAAGWRRALFYLLQFTWGLPVNIFGLLVFLCCRKRFRSEPFCSSIVTCLPGDRGGPSLGVFRAYPKIMSTPLSPHIFRHTASLYLAGRQPACGKAPCLSKNLRHNRRTPNFGISSYFPGHA